MEVALGPWPGIVQAAARGGFPGDFLLVLFFVGFFLNLDCGSWRWGGGLALLEVLFGCFFIFILNFLLWGFYLFKALGLPRWRSSGLTSLCASQGVFNNKNKPKKGTCALSWAVASMLCASGMEPGEEERDQGRSFDPFGHNLLLLSCAEGGSEASPLWAEPIPGPGCGGEQEPGPAVWAQSRAWPWLCGAAAGGRGRRWRKWFLKEMRCEHSALALSVWLPASIAVGKQSCSQEPRGW